MSLRLSTLQVCFGAASMTLASLLVCSAQTTRERGWPIEFSTPKRPGATNNLNALTSKKDDLKQLEDEFYQTLQSSPPQTSLDGVAARPTRPSAGSMMQNKRVKELMERRKSWVFSSPEDLMATPSAEEALKDPRYSPDGQDQKEMTTIERYYRDMTAKRSGAKNPTQSKDDDLFGTFTKPNPRDEVAPEEDANLPRSVKERVEALSKQSEPGDNNNPFVQSAPHGNLLDTFGLAVKPLSKEQIQEHKKFMDAHHAILDSSWHPPATDSSGRSSAVIIDAMRTGWKPTESPSSASSPAPHKGLETELDVVDPVLGPPGLPDVNAKALGQLRPTLALPKIESTRSAPVAPSFTPPTRSFH
jgi:hypothetical protein